MGFKPVPHDRLIFPGPVDPDRLLYCELAEGAFDGIKGKVLRGL
jgi:predicted N-acetyltransferase YhbS